MQPGYDRPRLQVLIAGRDVTERCDSIVFSATDAGGFEICTLGLPAVDRPQNGTPIVIRSGLEVAWAGRIAETAEHSQYDRATKTTGGEGWVGLMQDNDYQMVYVDRDLSQFTTDSTAQQADMLAGGFGLGTFQILPDRTTNLPALNLQISDVWGTGSWPLTEAWYDAGDGNLIAKIYWSESDNVHIGTGGWQGTLQSTETDAPGVGFWQQQNMTFDGSGYWAPANRHRFATVFFTNVNKPGGLPGDTFFMSVVVALYGNHYLPGRGPDPVGFYPSDIARHALAQCPGIVPGEIATAFGYIAPHVVYRTPTPPATVVDDMAKLMGWTWGVWEPSGALSSLPRLFFGPPPTDATAVVSKAECNQLDVTSRLGDLYNVCQVTYTDAAGIQGIATVYLANPQLDMIGISRTLELDMAYGSRAAAQTFGLYALALSQTAARAAGSVTLPASVRLPYGGSKPAHLLRPGRDRLRIIDLTDGGPALDRGTVRRDVFRISRIETTTGADGVPSSVAELDNGANLLETLQARMAVAAGVVGSGASG